MSGPAPAVAAVRRAVRAELADLPGDALVLVACSGGGDSLALAAGVAFETVRRGRLVAGAVVVDHGWHPSSGQVAATAAEVCRRLGLDPVEVAPAHPAGRPGHPTGGPEAAARTARYAALDAAAERLGAAAVLLGHTLDDQAETVLLGLARGSGARSLAGMPARRGRYRRPLLELSRATTAAACAAQGLTPWVDPANADPAYSRVRVRSAMGVLEEALGPGVVAALARTAAQLAEDAEALEALAEQVLAAADGSVAVLAAAPTAVRRRALLTAIRAAGSPAGSVHRSHVLAVDALITGYHGQGPVQLPGGVVAVRDCGRLAVAVDPALAAAGDPRGQTPQATS